MEPRQLGDLGLKRSLGMKVSRTFAGFGFSESYSLRLMPTRGGRSRSSTITSGSAESRHAACADRAPTRLMTATGWFAKRTACDQSWRVEAMKNVPIARRDGGKCNQEKPLARNRSSRHCLRFGRAGIFENHKAKRT